MIWLGLIIALIRVVMGFTVEPEPMTLVDVYKDFAHIFIGGLGVAWWIERKTWQWNLFWFLCIVEVLVALLSRIL